MINYIKKEKLIYFAGYFVINIDLQKIFPQNGDYYGKRDKFFKLKGSKGINPLIHYTLNNRLYRDRPLVHFFPAQ